MAYRITAHTRKAAARLGVTVKPSTVKGKKIDVFKAGKKIASVGALGYGDYPTFLRTHGKEYAAKKRANYKKRHQNNRTKKGSNGYYADQLLW